MKKRLAVNLLLTFLLSLLLTGLMFAAWYGSKQRGFEEGQAMTLLLIMDNLFQNILLAISTIAMFSLSNDTFHHNPLQRSVLYYGGPVLLTIIFVAFIGSSWFDKVGFLLPGISFLAIHTFFYFRLKKATGTD